MLTSTAMVRRDCYQLALGLGGKRLMATRFSTERCCSSLLACHAHGESARLLVFLITLVLVVSQFCSFRHI